MKYIFLHGINACHWLPQLNEHFHVLLKLSYKYFLTFDVECVYLDLGERTKQYLEYDNLNAEVLLFNRPAL